MKNYLIIILMLLSGTLNGIAQNTMATSILVDAKDGLISYSNTQNTFNYTNNYNGTRYSDVFYKFTLDRWMAVTINHAGSNLSDTYIYMLSSTGNLITSCTGVQSTSASQSTMESLSLTAGTYYVVSEGISMNGVITTNITSKEVQKTEYNLGSKSSPFSYSHTQNTKQTTKAYSGPPNFPTNDVFYKLTLTQPLDITISHCGSEVKDTYISVLDFKGGCVAYNDDSNSLSGGCPVSTNSYLKQRFLPGTYYIVSRGKSENGNITTSIKGDYPPNEAIIDLGKIYGDITAAFNYTHTQDTRTTRDSYKPPRWNNIFSPNDIVYKFKLDVPMKLNFSHAGSVLSCTQLHLLKRDMIDDPELGIVIDVIGGSGGGLPPDAYPVDRSSSVFETGIYYLVSEGCLENGIITTTIIGEPYRFEIDMGTFNASFTKEHTQDTRKTSNSYDGLPTRDAFYKFTIQNNMEIEISHCKSTLDDTYLYLLDASEKCVASNDDYIAANACSNTKRAYLKIDDLSPGTYYIVSEGKSNDGIINTMIEGRPVKKVIDIGDINNTSDLTFIENTAQTSNRFGLSTNEIYYRFYLSKNMDIDISARGPSTGTMIYLLDDQNNIIETADGVSGIKIKNLLSGVYYVVSEGKMRNENIYTTIKTLYRPLPETASKYNYIHIRSYTKKDASDHIDIMNYYDGLGRPIQKVEWGITPRFNDLVSLQEYDAFGRESNSWLPAAIAGNKGAYTAPATVMAAAKTTNTNNGTADQLPYSKPVYEASPLNRVLEQYGPGTDWHNNKKAVRTTYMINVAGVDTLNCIYYIPTDPGDTIVSVTYMKNYPTGQIYVTRIEDEDGNTSFEFKDKLGQVVLTRQIVRNGSTKDLHDTYYVYDDFGNLKAVLPPLAADAMKTGTSWANNSSDLVRKYAYLYKYDGRNRCIAKRLPGTHWTYFVYDKADRLILTQDGEQRAKGEWLFTIPDAFGRIVVTGTCKNTLNFAAVNPINTVVKASQNLSNTTNKYYDITGITLSTPSVLTASYYDNYNHRTKEDFAKLPYDATQYNTRYGDDTDANKYKHKGMLTGTLTALLDGSGKYLYTAMYYDNRGRLIQSHSTSHLAGGIEKEYVAYNFTGQPTKKKHIHTATGKTTQTEDYAYNYDHAGRLTKTTHKLNGGTEMVLAENTYDELGRLKTKKSNNNEALKSTYAYNVRSWLKTIGGRFSEQLYYNEDYRDTNNNVSNKKSYTGNISAMSWTTYDSKNRNYFYDYDNLSRLTKANYTEAKYAGAEASIDRYSASYQYDKHGNIKTLIREGIERSVNMTPIYNTVDNLIYEYTGNQLKKITDSSGKIWVAESEDFKDNSNAATEYFFNTNGAMTKDLNKGISDIKYNSLNLPLQMDIKSPTGEGRNLYTYSASGVKLKVKHTYNPNFSTAPVIGSDVTLSLLTQVKETDYVGNKIYENGKLKRILVDGGYWEDGKYYFFRQDHLGNTRVVQDQDGTLIQRKYYYPFGAGFPENTKDNGKQPYKYNAKELDQMHRLDWYDYSARHYDPALGRFTTVDPLAEDYYSISPYAYVMNNPLRFTDPTGMAANDTINGGELPTVVIETLNNKKQAIVKTDIGPYMVLLNRETGEYYAEKGIRYNEMTVAHLPMPGGGSWKNLWQAAKDVTKSLASLASAAKNAGGFSKTFLSTLSKSISIQKQARHIAGSAPTGKGYLNSQADAQKILDAVHSGQATYLGTSSQGHIVVKCTNVTGTNVNLGAGISNQSTNVFMIKGTVSPSVVPTNPNWTP